MLHLKLSKQNTYLSFIISSQKSFLVISGNKQRSKTGSNEEIFNFMSKKKHTKGKKNLIGGNGFWKTSIYFFHGKINKSMKKSIVKRACKESMFVHFFSWICKFFDSTEVESFIMKRNVKTLRWKRITSTILCSFLYRLPSSFITPPPSCTLKHLSLYITLLMGNKKILRSEICKYYILSCRMWLVPTVNSPTHTKSKSDSCASILHRHNAYKTFHASKDFDLQRFFWNISVLQLEDSLSPYLYLKHTFDDISACFVKKMLTDKKYCMQNPE